MKRQYLINVKLTYILESPADVEHVANDVYAQCAELAYSEDHLLYLEVSPCPLPLLTSDAPPDSGHAPVDET